MKTEYLCPICRAKLEKSVSFIEAERKGDYIQNTKAYIPGVLGPIKIQERIKDLHVNKRITRYYCATCKIGFRYKDVIKQKEVVKQPKKMTCKEFKDSLLTLL